MPTEKLYHKQLNQMDSSTKKALPKGQLHQMDSSTKRTAQTEWQKVSSTKWTVQPRTAQPNGQLNQKDSSTKWTAKPRNGQLNQMDSSTKWTTQLNSENIQRVSLLVSPDLQSQDVIIGWVQMMNWNLLQLEDFSALPQSLSSLQL